MFRTFKYRQLAKMGAVGIVAIAIAGGWYSLRTSPAPTVAIRPHDIVSPTSVKSDYGNLPLSFELNKGQTAEDVKFLARSSGYTLFLTSDETVVRFPRQNNSK